MSACVARNALPVKQNVKKGCVKSVKACVILICLHQVRVTQSELFTRASGTSFLINASREYRLFLARGFGVSAEHMLLRLIL